MYCYCNSASYIPRLTFWLLVIDITFNLIVLPPKLTYFQVCQTNLTMALLNHNFLYVRVLTNLILENENLHNW